MNDTATRLTVHANCDHPATKAARAACRRAKAAPAPVWVDATRESVAKGDTIRVTVQGDTLQTFEGQLIGWGAKRLIMSVTANITEGYETTGLRQQFDAEAVTAVQARA